MLPCSALGGPLPGPHRARGVGDSQAEMPPASEGLPFACSSTVQTERPRGLWVPQQEIGMWGIIIYAL